MTRSLTHRAFVLSLLALMITLSGCAGHLERPSLPNVFVDPPPSGQTNGTYSLALFDADFAAYKLAAQNPNPTEPDASTLRNKMVYGVLAEIDYVYHKYEIALFMNENSFKVATDVLQLGLGMASTITNGERSKTVLSAVLTGVTGTSLSIDKNFFRQQTVQALISSMQTGRDRTKAIILQRLREPVSTYPFQAARSDLAAYFFAGTLPGALQQLNQTAAAKAEDQRVALKDIELTDVQTATDINKAVAAAFKSGDLSQVIAYLNGMGQTVPANADQDTVLNALRTLGEKIINDPNLRAKQQIEAQKAGLIK